MSGKTSWFWAILGVVCICAGAELTFTGTGSYLTPSSWPGGALPGAGDTVLVAPGATLTLDGTPAQPQTVAELAVARDNTGLAAATFNLSGTALNADAVTVGSRGTVRVGGGGRLNVRRLAKQRISGSYVFDGATLGVRGSGGTLASYFDFVDEVEIGEGGLTFDTGDNTVYAGNIPVAPDTTAAIAKKGAGTLGLQRLPATPTFNVDEGTLVLGGGKPDRERNLAHRWNFSGSLVDLAGGYNSGAYYRAAGAMPTGAEAMPVRTDSAGDVTFEDGQRIRLGGGEGATMIGLGESLLPDEGATTIELWATVYSHTPGERLFSIGSSQSSGLVFTLSTGGDAGDESSLSLLGATGDETGPGRFETGVEYYIAVVITPAPGGGSVVNVFTRNARTRERVGAYSVKTAWTVASLGAEARAWLGWSWWNNAVPNVAFDEMRVWNTAITEADADRHVRMGPDRLPGDEDESIDDNVYPDHPSAELRHQNFLTHRWGFNGDWTDSVGGRTATKRGTWDFTPDARQVQTLAGGKNQDFIELGANLLPTTGPVTLEMWLTLHGRQTWEKCLSAGAKKEDSLLFTLTSGNDPNEEKASSLYVMGSGANCENKLGSGLCPLNVECYLAITIVPVGGNTHVIARLWNTETKEMIGSVTYVSTWSVAKMTQTYANLNCSTFWEDPDPQASYNEVRVWNVGFGERQQRNNLELGPDEVPLLDTSAVVDVPVDLSVAEGAAVDLMGTTLALHGLAGAGTVRNGNLEISGVLSPGGDGAVGTLTLDAGVKVNGTIRLNAGDMIVCSGSFDLREARIEILDRQNLKGLTTFMTSAAKGLLGPAKEDNLKGSAMKLVVTEDRAFIMTSPLVILLQ